MLKSFGVLCGGKDGGIVAAREIPAAVREVERRVLLYDVGIDVGLITCVCVRIGQAPNHSAPVSGGTGIQSGPP